MLSALNEDISNESDPIKINEVDNKNSVIKIYTAPKRTDFLIAKRLICRSVLESYHCEYAAKCTYAHSLDQQVIDSDRAFTYKIILDPNLMHFFSVQNPKTEDLYKGLIAMTHSCKECLEQKCTGGYNCRNGACQKFLKVCQEDLLHGNCTEKLEILDINMDFIQKLFGTITTTNEQPFEYIGCKYGHHLTHRNKPPIYDLNVEFYTEEPIYNYMVPYSVYALAKISSKKNNYDKIWLDQLIAKIEQDTHSPSTYNNIFCARNSSFYRLSGLERDGQNPLDKVETDDDINQILEDCMRASAD
jgi:hypothetical protein